MRNTTGFILALLIGALVGVGLTWFSLRNGPISGAATLGPWRVWTALSLETADPYARAHIARTGDLPLGTGEGLTFLAETDSAGRPLDGACQYRLDPIEPHARWWTLAAYGPDNRPVANPAGRVVFTSAEVTRLADGAALVVLGPTARPGDWLPTAKGRLSLALRLYDSPIADSIESRNASDLPPIIAEGCP